jgi:hypothetical protein
MAALALGNQRLPPFVATGVSLLQTGTPREHVSAIVVAAIGMGFSIGPMVFGTFSLFMLPITAQFGWNRSQLAFALAICAVFAALSECC